MATDLTLANNFVLDPLRERAINVEVGIIHSIATRVIHGIRVFPRGARGIDVGLLVYDAMRQLSMVVDGTTIDDFRWSGIPESLDLSGNPVHVGRRPALNPGPSLQGVHYLPGVTPTSIRSDHGSIFVGEHFRALMNQFGIELRLSRGKKPTDNPHSERKMEDLERAYQQSPGYKGRSIQHRGRSSASKPTNPSSPPKNSNVTSSAGWLSTTTGCRTTASPCPAPPASASPHWRCTTLSPTPPAGSSFLSTRT
jgi:putative transposase